MWSGQMEKYCTVILLNGNTPLRYLFVEGGVDMKTEGCGNKCRCGIPGRFTEKMKTAWPMCTRAVGLFIADL